LYQNGLTYCRNFHLIAPKINKQKFYNTKKRISIHQLTQQLVYNAKP